MKTFKFLVLSGDGINCERETGLAFARAGLDHDIVSVNRLITSPNILLDFDGLALPGGFSFGDELGSGQVLALKFKHALDGVLMQFLDRQSPIIGICNGFQVLVKLGLLPDPKRFRTVALAPNCDGHFIDTWQTLDVCEKSHCHWTKTLAGKTVSLPVRHGEGRIVFKDEASYHKVIDNNLVALRYRDNPNGSHDDIAGLTDPSGTILGLMPHPEAAVSKLTSPYEYTDVDADGDGHHFFASIKTYLEESAHG